MINLPDRQTWRADLSGPALTMADPVKLLTHLREHIDAAFDPRNYPTQPQHVAPFETRAALLQALEQTLTAARSVTALIDRVKAGTTPDRTISAVCDAAAVLQETFPSLITAVTSTCPRAEDNR